jgi:hypothetical protein
MAKRQRVYSAEAPIMGNYRKRKVVEGVLYLELRRIIYNTRGEVIKESSETLSPRSKALLSKRSYLKTLAEALGDPNSKI